MSTRSGHGDASRSLRLEFSVVGPSAADACRRTPVPAGGVAYATLPQLPPRLITVARDSDVAWDARHHTEHPNIAAHCAVDANEEHALLDNGDMLRIARSTAASVAVDARTAHVTTTPTITSRLNTTLQYVKAGPHLRDGGRGAAHAAASAHYFERVVKRRDIGRHGVHHTVGDNLARRGWPAYAGRRRGGSFGCCPRYGPNGHQLHAYFGNTEENDERASGHELRLATATRALHAYFGNTEENDERASVRELRLVTATRAFYYDGDDDVDEHQQDAAMDVAHGTTNSRALPAMANRPSQLRLTPHKWQTLRCTQRVGGTWEGSP